MRLCVCYRRLNKVTIQKKYPLLRIDDLIGNHQIDLRSGYHQIRLKLEDVPKTTFKMRYGYYKYSVILFGVSNAPGMFMEYMSITFHMYLDQFVVVFLDDLLIYSKSGEERVGHLRVVLQTLKENQLYAKLSKCELSLREVSFVGHEISNGGKDVDPPKINKLL